MADKIAYCGLNCAQCPAYRATRSGKRAVLETVLIYWREIYDAPHLTVADLLCDGCQADGRLNSYCQSCAVRSCARAQGVPSCAYCTEYPCAEMQRRLAACDRRHAFFAHARTARATLEKIELELY